MVLADFFHYIVMKTHISQVKYIAISHNFNKRTEYGCGIRSKIAVK